METLIISLTINGLVFSSMLFLFSIGLNLIFGYLRVLNMGHGSFYTLGAYISMALITMLVLDMNLPFLLIFPLVFVAGGIVGLVGLIVEPTIMRRVYKSEHAVQLLLTFGLLLVIDDVCKMIWGLQIYNVPEAYYFLGNVQIGIIRFPAYNLFVLIAAFLLALTLWFILCKTMFGRVSRAIAEHREIVSTLGVNSARVFTMIFALGIVFAGWGGSIIMPMLGIYPGMGLEPLILSFIVVTIGGLGSLKGALIGSFIVGIIRSIGIGLFPEIDIAIIYLIMVAILLIRPNGLFGRKEIVW